MSVATPSISEREQELCRRIAPRGPALLRDLAAHVAIPTGHNFQPGLDRYRAALVERLTSLGAAIETVPGDVQPTWLGPETGGEHAITAPILIARHRGSKDSPRVLISGHIDTVHDPHGPFQTLTPAADGKTVVGPGAVDMKGGILIALGALEALAEAGVDLNWTFVLNSDEETGSFCSDRMLRALAKEHDVGLALEPGLPGGALAVERMGSGQFMIEVFGRSAHVGRDFASGVSAVHELGRIIARLAELAKPKEGVIVNVGPLKGGLATNIVVDYAACWGNVRFADPRIGERLGQSIDALGTRGDALPRVVVQRNWNRPAKPLTEGTKKLAELARAAAEDLGQTMAFASTGGVCDGNNLQAAGLPTIDTLGVRGGNLHRTDEFVEVASLVERCQLLAVLLARLASGGAKAVRAAAPGSSPR